MIHRMYAIFDSKLGAFLRPFFMANDRVAIRTFVDACSNGDSEIAKNPEDYSLFYFGWWNQEDGSMEVEDKRCIANGGSSVRSN